MDRPCRPEEVREAWRNSNAACVAEHEGRIAGYIRALTDTRVTLYVCELLVHESFRAYGIGNGLMKYVHQLYPSARMELLASSTSHSYYETKEFRSFYGFRKTILE
ncbi:GNAT family N-acetyltransferase [Peribacillus sp. SCS-37]|uniref:GNAT family N-acetyltransferase n=1 Tax=Paraperibacillus esterisolvens TaxID=3115296 RepID=UPI003906294B